MTSILDQNELASTSMKNTSLLPSAMTSSGYISMEPQDNTPMFLKQKMNFNPSDTITHMVVGGDILVIAMANNMLFRMDLKNSEKSEEITLAKIVQPNTKLNNLFLDPLGNHLLIAVAAKTKNTGTPELFYLHKSTSKVKTIAKARGHEITEVGWNHENDMDITTGPILLGTSLAHIMETELCNENETMFQTGIEQYWRQVFDLGKGTETPITGIEFQRVNKTSKYYIFVTTPERLYQFIGHTNVNEKPLLQPIFTSYLNVKETDFQELPSTMNYSKLQFFYDEHNVAKTFAWMTGHGIFYGKLDPTAQQSTKSVYTHNILLDYPTDPDSSTEKLPLTFVLTEFHALIMYDDRVKAISLLDQKMVHEEKYSEAYGKLINLVKNGKNNAIWSTTDKLIFRYRITREERFLWRIYCDQNKFDLARQYCNNNPAYLDSINIKEAEMLFNKKDYNNSASMYAETLSSFETVCLKFLDANQIDALKVYLNSRLEKASEDEDKTLVSMLVTWMCELYLSQLSYLRRIGKCDSVEYSTAQSDFEVFLLQPKVKTCLLRVKRVIYDLMSSHGDVENLIKVNILNEDFENVIIQHIYNKNYLAALEVLHAQKNLDLYYQFGSVLLQEVPKHTVNAFISLGPKLTPVKLLPSLLSCDNDEEHVAEVIRYLEFMIENFNVRDKAVHNYLLTLYAHHKRDSIMRYLVKQGTQLDSVLFDVNYALRLCCEKNLTEACVKLSALLGRWESAVKMALTVDIYLAKDIANQPDDDDQLKKKLWLMIAQHEINRTQDVKTGMQILKECPLLKIKHILPFFTDLVSIDHLREPLCQALEECNNKIEDLIQEEIEATASSETVRAELAELRDRSITANAKDFCDLCQFTLLLRPFILFPCGHRFHADCMQRGLAMQLDPDTSAKLQELERQLNFPQDPKLTSNIATKINEILCNECLYCGEYMINTLDTPFIEENKWEYILKEWE